MAITCYPHGTVCTLFVSSEPAAPSTLKTLARVTRRPMDRRAVLELEQRKTKGPIEQRKTEGPIKRG